MTDTLDETAEVPVETWGQLRRSTHPMFNARIRLTSEAIAESYEGAFIRAQREEMARLARDMQYRTNLSFWRGKPWIAGEWMNWNDDPDLEMDIGL